MVGGELLQPGLGCVLWLESSYRFGILTIRTKFYSILMLSIFAAFPAMSPPIKNSDRICLRNFLSKCELI